MAWRIRLLVNLPILPKHGAMKGRVFDVTRDSGPARRSEALFYFIGDAGEECAAYGSECEDVTPQPKVPSVPESPAPANKR